MNRSWVEEKLSIPMLLTRMSKANRGVESAYSFPYGNHPYQYVQVFTPSQAKVRRDALIYFIHGGGWRKGNPRDVRFIGKFFADQGLYVAMPGYRHSPRHTWPAARDDIFTGLHHTLRFAKELKISTRKVFVAGMSTGAQLAALLMLDREAQKKHKLDPDHLTGLISLAGPLDFSACTDATMRKLIKGMLGKEDPAKADPIKLLDDSWKWPVICIHGDQDPLVHPRASANFTERVNQIKLGRGSLYFREGLHHSDLATLFLDDLPTTRALLSWMDMLLL
ncbi:alpha/beta hydrolase [bacterium]|nr:alpha/beta hydrolase [bacterium]